MAEIVCPFTKRICVADMCVQSDQQMCKISLKSYAHVLGNMTYARVVTPLDAFEKVKVQVEPLFSFWNFDKNTQKQWLRAYLIAYWEKVDILARDGYEIGL